MSVNFKTHSHPNDTSKQQHESKEPGCYKSCTLKHPHNPLLNHDRIYQIKKRLKKIKTVI